MAKAKEEPIVKAKVEAKEEAKKVTPAKKTVTISETETKTQFGSSTLINKFNIKDKSIFKKQKE